MGRYEKDDVAVEAGDHHYADQKFGAPVYADESGAVAGESFAIGNTTYARMQRMVGKFGVEQRGIERVPENEQTDHRVYKLGTMWLAANMVVSSFAIGVLAVPVFFLGWWDGFLTILFINALGVLPVCFFSTFGPVFGLRQMVLSRFYFGYYGVKLIAIFNVLACLGWSSVNVMVGAQLINAVNPAVPGYAGIIIIAACTFLITLFGYKVVHTYEFWAWIPAFIVFLIVLGEFAHGGTDLPNYFVNIPMASGVAEAASVLSFSASVFGFAVGWTSYASDYSCYMQSSSRRKTFLWTFAGLIFPLCFTEWLGLAVATAIDVTQLDLDPSQITNPWTLAYVEGSVGGLLNQVLTPHLGKFGQFCLVILALSIIANNCPNIYSVTFSLQILARRTQAVPRFVWTLVGTIVYVAISIPGYSHFASYLEDFMLLIGYWLAIYCGIAITEHVVFRRSFSGYVVSDYNRPERLPPGVAAIVAFGFGVMGAVLGMSQVWFVGPIGKLVNSASPYGGDIGFELAFAFSALTYAAGRTVEIKIAKR